MNNAIKNYIKDVKEKSFPNEKEEYWYQINRSWPIAYRVQQFALQAVNTKFIKMAAMENHQRPKTMNFKRWTLSHDKNPY